MTKIYSGRGHKVQGRDRRELAYWNPMQPGLAIWGAFWTSIFILVDGYQTFFTWSTQEFLTAYLNIPIFFVLWIGWTIYMRRPFWRAHEMDFVTVCHSGARDPYLICSRYHLRRAFQPSKRRMLQRCLRATSLKRFSTPCFSLTGTPCVSPMLSLVLSAISA